MSSSCGNEQPAVRGAAGGALRASPVVRRGVRRIAGVALLALAWAAPDLADPVRADGKVVERFLEHYLTGCLRQSGARGHDRLRGHAWCVCAVAQLRMEGDEADLEEVARRVARGEPIDGLEIFNRAARNRRQCDSIGTHDDSPSNRLERERDFGRFTIALPPGFLLLARTATPSAVSYAFRRFHADLRSAATLEVVIRRASPDGRSDSDADEFRLRGLLAELARSQSNFRVVDTGETSAGHLRFRRAHWRAAEAGDSIAGETYAGSSGETVVLIRLQDQERFAPRTMPVMRAALETLRLRH